MLASLVSGAVNRTRRAPPRRYLLDRQLFGPTDVTVTGGV